MLISESKRFIWGMPPKTASSSILNAIRGYFDHPLSSHRTPYKDPPHKMDRHKTWAEHERDTPGFMDQFKDYKSLTFVRNPWDRAVSFWLYVKRRRMVLRDWNPDVPEGCDPCATLDQFLHSAWNNLYVKQLQGLWPQTEWTKHCDKVFYFEQLPHSFAKACGYVGIPVKALSRVQNAPNRQHYSVYYTPDLAEFVREKYAEEIGLFGYDYTEE